MKKLLSLLVMLMLSIALHAQHNVTKFLGIPVDGTKTSMIKKLENKGFTYDVKNDVLSGEFNGGRVNIIIKTYKNKVWRIAIYNQNPCNEAQIKIKYNALCQQFNNNAKYTSFKSNEIPKDEDISYQMSVNSKEYQAIYYQLPKDEELSKRSVWFTIYEKYSKYNICIFYDNEYNHDTTDEL
jgi:hypothetical protein